MIQPLRKQKLRKKESLGSRIFNIVNSTLLILIALTCLLPFLNIIASSFASTEEVIAKKFILFPVTFSLDAYRYILSTPTIFRGLGVSVGVTIVGTVVSMIFTALWLMDYPEDIYSAAIRLTSL